MFKDAGPLDGRTVPESQASPFISGWGVLTAHLGRPPAPRPEGSWCPPRLEPEGGRGNACAQDPLRLCAAPPESPGLPGPVM